VHAQIQEMLERRIQYESQKSPQRASKDTQRFHGRPYTKGAILRGTRVVQSLFYKLQQEFKGTQERLTVSFQDVVSELRNYEGIPRYTQQDQTDDTVIMDDFLIAVGLDMITPDPGRTSVIWRVAEALFYKQRDLVTLEFDLDDRPGMFHRLTKLLDSLEINMYRIETHAVPLSYGEKRVIVTVTTQDRERFIKQYVPNP